MTIEIIMASAVLMVLIISIKDMAVAFLKTTSKEKIKDSLIQIQNERYNLQNKIIKLQDEQISTCTEIIKNNEKRLSIIEQEVGLSICDCDDCKDLVKEIGGDKTCEN